MHRFIIKRLLTLVLIVLGVSFIVFAILYFTPSDPGRLILGQRAEQSAVDALNEQLGYNDPFFTQYFNFIKKIVTKFDFGQSYMSSQPVMKEILIRFPKTLTLAFFGVLISSIIGVPLGIYSAVRQYSVTDTIFTVTSMLFASIPGFWFGMMLMLIFSQWLKLVEVTFTGHPSQYILPLATIAIPTAAGLLRLTRSTMLETIRQDYIRTALAKGASETSAILKHALKNALLPIITIMGMNFGYLLGGAILVESVFSMPGLGMLVVTAIRTKDVPQVLATTVFLATLFCLIILIIDILYAFIDPRIKAQYSKKR